MLNRSEGATRAPSWYELPPALKQWRRGNAAAAVARPVSATHCPRIRNGHPRWTVFCGGGRAWEARRCGVWLKTGWVTAAICVNAGCGAGSSVPAGARACVRRAGTEGMATHGEGRREACTAQGTVWESLGEGLDMARPHTIAKPPPTGSYTQHASTPHARAHTQTNTYEQVRTTHLNAHTHKHARNAPQVMALPSPWHCER